MITPVEVSQIQTNGDRIERLGGIWLGRPWSMSAENLIREIERPDDKRQWDFFVTYGAARMRIALKVTDGRKVLTTPLGDGVLLSLPATYFPGAEPSLRSPAAEIRKKRP